jgi:hypothetical protein
MSLSSSKEKLVIPYEVYQALDTIEKIVIRKQVERGEVRIEPAKVN